MSQPGTWRDRALEAEILPQLSIDEPWAMLEAFSTLTRLSGSEDEAKSVKYLTDKLDGWGVTYTVHRPTCLISWPRMATLRTLGEGGREYTVKTPSLSPSTDGEEVTGELVYIPCSSDDLMNGIQGRPKTTRR